MKFDGMIFSDCLEMDGVRATVGTEKGAVMALKVRNSTPISVIATYLFGPQAGTDCVMICHTISAQVGAIEQVIHAVKSDELSQKDIQASVERVRRLKVKYSTKASAVTSQTKRNTILQDAEKRNLVQAALAADIYAMSVTVVRTEPGLIPISPYSAQMEVVFVSPGQTSVGGGAVESGEEKTREPHTLASYIDLIRVHSPGAINIRFHNGSHLSAEDESHIAASEIIIFATSNACLEPYQKAFGRSLGENYGKKLIVVATCDPYDFLEKAEIKNYITIYEPTIPAFKAAIDVIFGVAKAQGSLPVGTPLLKHTIMLVDFSSSDKDFEHSLQMWQIIFPTWPIERPRLSTILHQLPGRHYIHEKGFCLAFLVDIPHGKISCSWCIAGIPTKGARRYFLDKSKD